MLTTALLSLSNSPTAPSGERTRVWLNEERCESWEELRVPWWRLFRERGSNRRERSRSGRRVWSMFRSSAEVSFTYSVPISDHSRHECERASNVSWSFV